MKNLRINSLYTGNVEEKKIPYTSKAVNKSTCHVNSPYKTVSCCMPKKKKLYIPKAIDSQMKDFMKMEIGFLWFVRLCVPYHSIIWNAFVCVYHLMFFWTLWWFHVKNLWVAFSKIYLNQCWHRHQQQHSKSQLLGGLQDLTGNGVLVAMSLKRKYALVKISKPKKKELDSTSSNWYNANGNIRQSSIEEK